MDNWMMRGGGGGTSLKRSAGRAGGKRERLKGQGAGVRYWNLEKCENWARDVYRGEGRIFVRFGCGFFFRVFLSAGIFFCTHFFTPPK